MLRIAVALGTTALAAAIAFQQAPRALVLRPPDATLGEPFSRVYSIRELADGRVLVSDNSRDSRLVVADLQSGSVRLIGSIGAGPGEYQAAGRLHWLPGDSTFFIDAPQRGRRWLLLHRDSIVVTLAAIPDAMRIVGADISGTDSSGRVIGIRLAGADQLSGNISRQKEVLLLAQRNGSRGDTIARLRGADQRVVQTGTRERPFWVVSILIGSVDDQAMLFPDGWIAIARQDPYRIEWRLPDGRSLTGPVVPWEAPRGDAREKRASLERLRRRSPNAKDDDHMPWAERLAPFRFGALLGTPEGNLLVLRSQWSQVSDTRYDLFDRSGRRLGQFAMPDSVRIVGFGHTSVYTSVTDGDGFQYLRRHPWP